MRKFKLRIKLKKATNKYGTKHLCLICLTFSFLLSAPSAANDFPTSARAEYVFACMSTNGQSREMLDKCSCSVDTIAGLMSYEEYIDAETTARMRLMSGERTAIFRDVEWVNKAIEKLRMAQAEAEIQCF